MLAFDADSSDEAGVTGVVPMVSAVGVVEGLGGRRPAAAAESRLDATGGLIGVGCDGDGCEDEGCAAAAAATDAARSPLNEGGF